MSKIGFLPCFSRYRHKDCPVENIYQKSAHIEKVRNLVSFLINCPDQLALKELGSYDIQTLRPTDSAESRKIFEKCDTADCNAVLRIDYGDNSFRIILGLSNVGKIKNAYIFMVDTIHNTFKKRKW